MAKAVHIPERIRRRNRRLSGLPRIPRDRTGMPWWQRLLRSEWTWVLLAALVVYAAALAKLWDVVRERKVDGQLQGFTVEVLASAAKAATPTVLVWSLVFLLIDRWRPQRLLMWFLALGWGATVACYLALEVNTWASMHLGITRGEMAASQVRAAVYIAPFVEEAAKASVVFFMAMLLRHRLVNRLSLVTLAGLSAIGFAFTENIIYFGRAMSYGARTTGAGDVEAAVKNLVFLRGVVTSWGHWSFTMMTGLGLAIGLRSRAKTVRVLAPVTGYLLAALGHMFFNSQASLGGQSITKLFMISGAMMCVFLLSVAITGWLTEGHLIRSRLIDYARMGWVKESDPVVFGSLRRRWLVLWLALFEGRRSLWATIRMIRAMTELAYLRDAMTRGLSDDSGLEREKELFATIRSLRGTAVDDPRGRKHRKVWGRWRKVPVAPGPSFPGPAGISGNWPSPTGTRGYAAVDPTWAPPGG